ncbi:MAG: DUF4058 family protein [Planctomycetaceae bacterium]|nr:DUF4058 family protein [Planctomycetaceae bacterium]
MKSPFPGMDPYLEEPNLWQDVHLSLVIAMRAQLNARLPPNYVARADKYVWIHEPDATARTRVRPDAYIVKHSDNPASQAPAAVAAPTTVVLPAARREGNKYLKILDAKSRRLVTVIELLSPANKKPGPDRDDYLTKRIDYLTAGVNLVEIDLLRAGERIPIGEPPTQGFDYYALVCRAQEMPKAGVWPFTVRDPMPGIAVPLLPTDSDVPLELRPCLDVAYEQGEYHIDIDYSMPPIPPLSEPDVQWARGLLEKAANSG